MQIPPLTQLIGTAERSMVSVQPSHIDSVSES